MNNPNPKIKHMKARLPRHWNDSLRKMVEGLIDSAYMYGKCEVSGALVKKEIELGGKDADSKSTP